jgi:hypothetical protein
MAPGAGAAGELGYRPEEDYAMRLKRFRVAMTLLVLGLSSATINACPFSGLVDDCFGENTISASEYDDLNALEQLLYEENSCGRYDRRSGSFWNLFD